MICLQTIITILIRCAGVTMDKLVHELIARLRNLDRYDFSGDYYVSEDDCVYVSADDIGGCISDFIKEFDGGEK